jgi:hypothetical protein
LTSLLLSYEQGDDLAKSPLQVRVSQQIRKKNVVERIGRLDAGRQTEYDTRVSVGKFSFFSYAENDVESH